VTAFSYCCIHAFRLHDQTENVLYSIAQYSGLQQFLFFHYL
jgi:hypothetical protein